MDRIHCDLCDSCDYQPYSCVAPRGQVIVQCQSCHLVYTASRPSGEELVKLSGTDPLAFRPPEQVAARRQDYYKMMLDEVGQFRGSGRLLDVGCSYGFLLKLARSGLRGPRCRASGARSSIRQGELGPERGYW